jgi:hypothetical protein
MSRWIGADKLGGMVSARVGFLGAGSRTVPGYRTRASAGRRVDMVVSGTRFCRTALRRLSVVHRGPH